MQRLHADKKIKALEGQIELLKSFISKKEPLITIEDYRRYIAKTKKAVSEYIDPTEYSQSSQFYPKIEKLTDFRLQLNQCNCYNM